MNILTSGLIVVHVDSLQLQVRVTMVGTCGVDAMLVRDHLPELKENNRAIYLSLNVRFD